MYDEKCRVTEIAVSPTLDCCAPQALTLIFSQRERRPIGWLL